MKALDLDNAAAKVLVDIAKTQDQEVGDGTTRYAGVQASLTSRSILVLSFWLVNY